MSSAQPQQRPLPAIKDLPALLVASDWQWHQASTGSSSRLRPHWWIGVDTKSRNWLVKMTNSGFAYREHVFAALAQRLGISCQSSAYLIVPTANLAPLRDIPFKEPYQLAIWLIKEHAQQPCSPDCPKAALLGRKIDSDAVLLEVLKSGVSCIKDLVRGTVLGHLCGQSEPPGGLLTIDHQYVVIDNECMFVDRPSLNQCSWLDLAGAREPLIDVCRRLALLPDKELLRFADLPARYVVTPHLNLADNLLSAKAAAWEYLDLFDIPVR
jgi:hypothetical protein